MAVAVNGAVVLAETQLGSGGVRVHAPRVYLCISKWTYSSQRFEGRRELVLVVKGYLDVAGRPSWAFRARKYSSRYDRRRGSCRRRRVFTGGLPGRVPPAAAASLGSGCELAPRRGHVRDARPLIGLIGVRSPRFFSEVCCNWDRSRMYHGAYIHKYMQARGETSLW